MRGSERENFLSKTLDVLAGVCIYSRARARVKNLFLTYITYIWELGDIEGVPFILEGTSGYGAINS